jgi:transcriptional regulator of heat shock response
MTAEERRKMVLRAVVTEHVRTAEPVSSETLISDYGFKVSSATIRGDMAELEARGLLEQPYTSAGRVPTEKGYRFFVKEFVGDGELSPQERFFLTEAINQFVHGAEVAMREFTKTMAALTEELVFMRVGDRTTHFSGISNLFRQPEFRENDLYVEVSRMFDDFDRVVGRVRQTLDEELRIFIGEENPFNTELSSVMATCRMPDIGEGVIGIVGPKRMDYATNVSRVRYVRRVLSDENENE